MVELALLASPVALGFASIAAQRRRMARNREILNRCLHEVRRPLQALALDQRPGHRGQVALAIDAVADLDRRINGGAAPDRLLVDAATLARQAVGRWRDVARASGRRVELAWNAGTCPVWCEPAAVSRAIDNLIANSIEHGGGTIRLEGSRAPDRVRVRVVDSGPDGGGRRGQRDVRRGHGMAIVEAIAASHGGRFATCGHDGGTTAVLEFPLAR